MTYTATRYEITAKHVDGRKHRLGFTARRSFPGLVAFLGSDAIQARLRELNLVDDAAPDGVIRRGVNASITCDGWTVGFSGETEKGAH